MESKLISIIVANYNNSNYLPECFESIINQTYGDIEIVVVDDCSTDNSRDVIQSYKNTHPDIFSPVILKQNVGVARARHEGILKARGSYIVTLDADDYYEDNHKLEKEKELISYYKKEKNEDIVAFSNILIEHSNGVKINVADTSRIMQGRIVNEIMARSCMIPRDFLFLKKMYFDAGGYDFSYSTHEDWDLKIRLSNKYGFYFTGITGTVYRIHGKGLSAMKYKIRTENLMRVFNKNIPLLNDNEKQKEIETMFKHFLDKRDVKFVKMVKSDTIGCKRKTAGLYLWPLLIKKVASQMGLRGVRLLFSQH